MNNTAENTAAEDSELPEQDKVITILIIDDRKAQHELYKEFLQEDAEHQYEFLNAYSALEGIEIYRDRDDIDCLLLDYKLPDINGIDILDSLADDGKSVPIVMLTGHGDEKTAVAAFRSGVQDYIAKLNISPESLCRSVNHAIENASMLQQIEQYRTELERSNQDLENFANIVSHDLKSPLRTITQHIQMLEKEIGGALSDDAKTSMKFIHRGADRMRRLIEGLFDFSCIGFEEVSFESVDANQIMEEVLENLASSIYEKGAKIEVRTLPTVRANGVQLLQLLQNLVDNAVKFCDIVPEVTVDAKQVGAFWRFTVTDNGIGIAEDYEDKIFSIFRRLHTEDDYQGTGMGLAICKRIIENHQGEIGYISTKSSGTSFYFTLPA